MTVPKPQTSHPVTSVVPGLKGERRPSDLASPHPNCHVLIEGLIKSHMKSGWRLVGAIQVSVVVGATFAHVLSRFRRLGPDLPLCLYQCPTVGGVPYARTQDQDIGARHCLNAEEVTSEGTRQNMCCPPDMAFPEGASDSKQIAQLETVTSE